MPQFVVFYRGGNPDIARALAALPICLGALIRSPAGKLAREIACPQIPVGGNVWFKHRAWIAVASVLSLANVAAIWFAAQPAEPGHATLHGVLAVLFGLGAQYLALRKPPTTDADAVTRQELEARLARLEPHQLTQALETIAIEVERIGENQRYLTKVLTERDANAPAAVRLPASPND